MKSRSKFISIKIISRNKIQEMFHITNERNFMVMDHANSTRQTM